MQAGERLLGHQHAVALDLVVGQLEGGVEHGVQRIHEILVLRGHTVELLAVGMDGERLDLVQAVELGFEVVIERRGADADRLGDVGPLGVLVAVATEVVDGGGDDVLPLASRGARTCGGAMTWRARTNSFRSR